MGLAFGLVFFPYFPKIGSAFKSTTIGAHLAIAMKESPRVTEAIWPRKTVDSQLIQIGHINSEIGNINREMGNLLNSGLGSIMKDLPTFVSFVEDGHFSDDSYISLHKTTAGLDMALKTLIVSTAMSKNGWQASPMLWYAREDIASTWECTFGPENYDICSHPERPYISYFYSNDSGNAYSLLHRTSNTSQLLHKIVDNGWSTLVALFDGAFNCTSSGNAGSDQPFKLKFDGTIDLSCVSQLFMCGCGACKVPLINGTCPMPKCPPCE